jgi:hypothetical protein
VVLASARSLGLQVHSTDDPESIVLRGVELHPHQVSTIRALARAFERANRINGLEQALTAGLAVYGQLNDLRDALPAAQLRAAQGEMFGDISRVVEQLLALAPLVELPGETRDNVAAVLDLLPDERSREEYVLAAQRGELQRNFEAARQDLAGEENQDPGDRG